MSDGPWKSGVHFGRMIFVLVMPWQLILMSLTQSRWGAGILVSWLLIAVIGNRIMPNFSPIIPLLLASWNLVFFTTLQLANLLPCDLQCAGGGYYQSIAGISVWWAALAAYGLLALMMSRDAWRGGWSLWTLRLQWFLLGVSLFFLGMSYALPLVCGMCLAAHLLVVTIAFFSVPDRTWFPWNQRLYWLLLGLLGTNLVFHHGPIRDVVGPKELTPPTAIQSTAPLTTTSPHDPVRERISANRSLGAPTAPWRLDFAIDLTCQHCADMHGTLMETLRPLAGDKLLVVTRHVVRRSAPASATLARYALAAAAIDHGTYDATVAVLLGSRPDAEWVSLRVRVGEIIDLKQLETTEQSLHETLLDIQRSDQQELVERNLGDTTPALALIDVTTGRTMRIWTGDVDIASFKRELGAAMAR